MGIGQTKIIKDWFNFFKEKYHWGKESISFSGGDSNILVKNFHKLTLKDILKEDKIPSCICFEFLGFLDSPHVINFYTGQIDDIDGFVKKLNKINIINVDRFDIYDNDISDSPMLLIEYINGKWVVVNNK